ncbi:hypothetical protein E3O44_17170 [Cryobacterium algoricola]|uniref:Uncharacterized protein n=1 Tax=Cryobacterium algoricola TaxID=1259183 RepID=A0ABY2I7D1_9MICO|nr:hypothetical protein [Cryobacterium algoricola]TFB83606.1 hypothetical protein E3O44_17170 [Cryobacterium algoricola]
MLVSDVGNLSVLLNLRHLYRSAGAEKSLTGYMVMAGIVCLVAINLKIAASSTKESEEQARKAESGSVTTVVSSPLTAPYKS